MAGATAPEARTRPLEQPSGVPRMMFAVARVKRAETAFPGLHGAVEVVTRGRHVEQLRGREHLAIRRQRPSGAPQAPSSPEPAERPQERPQARETPPQAPQEPPKPIRTKKALTDRFKTRLDERLAENERKQAEKQAEPDMEETWDLSDPADPLNIGMGWGTGGHGLGL